MNIENWLTVPLRRANAAALVTTIAVMLFLIAYEPTELEPDEFRRTNAILLMGMHAALHIGALNALRLMILLHVDHAEDALESYRDPRRISHLDLAAAWLGFYTLVPYIAEL